ncbi:MAG TPA: bis(5'-nucleosyl)-tetraphosphatase (symmetrical) YqeK [Candidatus Onthocola gallistercoris]|uniref:bis(5'-nucleosyl)-tetraphosphatase (symmetrical) n=1 Tax=Candidatus Onthocola gallistercoris TaxID=2840876 RepID=A0A9D1HG58_9FIRM|nr:bis(5'-nucleosyl)-tetraphosphatase (symmetrical) YqeK [Candidatus Onthocola gallistercoris]
MTEKDFMHIQKDIEKKQSASRFEHTLGVQYTSACLAMAHGVCVEDARLAGLLHDCAKQLDDKTLLKEAEKYHLDMTDVERRQPYLLHGKVGAVYAKEKYHVEDPDILNAITYHTTGRPGMSILEKIVFTADYIEPGRDKAPNLKELRQEAFRDIDKAVWLILKQTLSYLEGEGGDIDGMTRESCQYYEQCVRREKA